jgi:predicted hydrocarbon binding protein
VTLPKQFLGHFVEALNAEIGQDTLRMLLNKGGVDAELADPGPAFRLEEAAATRAYDGIQTALRLHYGRGARGILIRIGRLMWPYLLAGAPLFLRARLRGVRFLPSAWRVKLALELLASLLRGESNNITVHSLDLNYMVVDHDFSTIKSGDASEPICFVTLGLLQECAYWASGHKLDVTETSCRAVGANACEFHIKAE